MQPALSPRMLGPCQLTERRAPMTLRFLGTTSDDGDCPTLYEREETGEIIVQGDQLTDPDELRQLRDVKASESFVVVPRELLTRYAPKE